MCEYTYDMDQVTQKYLYKRGVNMKKRYLSAGLTLILSAAILSSSFSVAAQIDTNRQEDKIIISDRATQDGIVYNSAYLDYLSAAEQGDTQEYGDVIPESSPPLSAAAVESSQSLSGTTQETFETVYDPRTTGLVTPVKDQGYRPTCGIFSALASMESFALKPNKLDKTYDLSENYFDYMLASNAFGDDVMNPYAPEYRPIGGNHFYGVWEQNVFYSAVLRGAILENEFPYTTASNVATLTDDSIFHTEPSAYVYGYIYEPMVSFYHVTSQITQNRIREIKRLVKEMGSCVLGIDPTYDFSTVAGQTPKCTYAPLSAGPLNANHSVCIVGWDDTFSKSNFVLTPENDGAFIVKDTAQSEEKGYFYLSYEDYFVSTGPLKTISDMSRTKRYENIYSYTMASPRQYPVSSGQPAIYANVYDVADGAAQQLEAVGVFTFYENTQIKIYVNPLDGTLSNTGLIEAYSGTIQTPGYTTVTLNAPVSLANSSGKYVVAVKVISESSGDESSYYLPVEQKDYKDAADPQGRTYRPYTPGTSFYSADGGATWEDWTFTGYGYKYNFCINGYTNPIPAQDSESLDIKFYKPWNWDNNLTIKLWNVEAAKAGSYAMIDLGDGVFSYTANGLTRATFSISDGAGHVSAQADASGKVTFAENRIIKRAADPIKILFKKPTNWNDKIRIYYYSNDEDEVQLKGWPGYTMQNDGNGWFSYTITDMDDVRILFTDGTLQEPALLQPGFEVKSGQNLIYQDREYFYEDDTPLDVQFCKPSAWGSDVYIQLLDRSVAKLPMTCNEDGIYEYSDSDLTASDIIISDGSGHQTATMKAAGPVTVKDNHVFGRPKEPIEVYFQRQTSWWKDIKIYYYSKTSYTDLVGWPGTSMTNIGNWWYQYTITDMDNIRVMFTDVTNQLPGPGEDGIALRSGERLVFDGDGTYRIESIDQEVILDEY